jgi:hypothetical protein
MNPTKYTDPHRWADYIDRFPRVVKLTDKIHIVPVRAIFGPAQLVGKNASSDRID